MDACREAAEIYSANGSGKERNGGGSGRGRDVVGLGISGVRERRGMGREREKGWWERREKGKESGGFVGVKGVRNGARERWGLFVRFADWRGGEMGRVVFVGFMGVENR
jgi:hypothetical protein